MYLKNLSLKNFKGIRCCYFNMSDCIGTTVVEDPYRVLPDSVLQKLPSCNELS